MKTLLIFISLLSLSLSNTIVSNDQMVSDESVDDQLIIRPEILLTPEQLVIQELKKNLTELTEAYNSLCQEIKHLSRHVLFHQHALVHVAKMTPHSNGANDTLNYHHETHDHHSHHHHNETENEVSTDIPAADPPKARTPIVDPDAVVVDPALIQSSFNPFARLTHIASASQHQHDLHPNEGEGRGVLYHHHHHSENHHSDERHDDEDHHKPCAEKFKCSLLHEHPCRAGQHEDSSKTFHQQYEEWFSSLMTKSTNKTGDNVTHETDASDHSKQISPNVQKFAEEMDRESVSNDDMVYATCDVIPNRHISLILQENVKGTINLWQKADGHGPLFAHLNLEGFRVPQVSEGRKKRESIIIPVETPLDPDETGSESQAMLSLERGFHVHISGDLSRDCQSTGTHYNPQSTNHGGPFADPRHVGDLGNIRLNPDGKIDAEYTFPKVSLVGHQTIIGRSLVIHAQTDDYGLNPDSESSVTIGNSGAKIACCLIQKVDRLPLLPDSKSSVNPIRIDTSDRVERENWLIN